MKGNQSVTVLKKVLEILFSVAYCLNEFREEVVPMRPSVALDMKRSAVREAVVRFRTANPRVFGSVLHGTDRDGSALDLLTSGDLPPKFRAKVRAEAQPV